MLRKGRPADFLLAAALVALIVLGGWWFHIRHSPAEARGAGTPGSDSGSLVWICVSLDDGSHSALGLVPGGEGSISSAPSAPAIHSIHIHVCDRASARAWVKTPESTLR